MANVETGFKWKILLDGKASRIYQHFSHQNLLNTQSYVNYLQKISDAKFSDTFYLSSNKFRTKISDTLMKCLHLENTFKTETTSAKNIVSLQPGK